TRAIKERLPHVMVSGGVSNVSFSFRGNDLVREAIHSVFLYHAIKAGMDMGIVNAGQLAIYEDLPADLRDAVEDVILARRTDATERLLEVAESYKGQASGHKAKERDLSDRISFARRSIPSSCTTLSRQAWTWGSSTRGSSRSTRTCRQTSGMLSKT